MTPETVLVTDEGFLSADPSQRFVAVDDLDDDCTGRVDIDLPPDGRPDRLDGWLDRAGTIRIAFPSFADGRGFTLARELRRRGFTGRLRAAGHVISDQYALARRCGFDEVEITSSQAERQPANLWSPAVRQGYLDLLR